MSSKSDPFFFSFSSRGQAATEFILTYGWMILALLAAIGAIVYFTGGFSRYVPDTCIVSTPITCAEYKAGVDGTVFLGLRTAEELSFVNVTLACPEGSVRSFAQQAVVPRNERLNGSLVLLSCQGIQGRFSGKFSVEYRIEDESVLHTALGEIRASVES